MAAVLMCTCLMGAGSAAAQTRHWDGSNTAANGAVDGGTGTWNNSDTNWTTANGLINLGWVGGIAIFEGTAGTVTLGESVNFSGLQFVVDGYQVVGAGNSLLADSSTTITVDAGNTATISAPIADGSGAASITKDGAGTLTLTGANTYSGTTTISAGTLQIGNGGLTGTLGTGAVDNAGTLTVNRINAITLANAIGGSGALTQAGSGTTTLTGANSYSGITTISAGTLQVGDGGTAGTLGTGAVVNDGTLTFNRSDAMTVANAISGSGAVVQAGAGTTTLTGANTYGGTTTINAGTLQIGNGGTAGTLGTGAVVNDGTLSINRSDAVTIANLMSGSGAFVQAGSGTTTLTAANTYGGATTVNAGTLQIGNGGSAGTLGAGAVSIASGATLTFNRSDSITVANTISGTGTIVQAGTGETTLTGNVAASATQVNAGTVIVNGTLSAPVTVTAVATLGGAGSISNDVTVNGTLSPGHGGAGTLTIGGNLTLAGGSILAFDLGAPDANASALNDLLVVGGNLALSGTVTLNVTDTGAFASTPGSYRLISYTGSLSGNATNIALGSLPGAPPNNAVIQTAVAGQVNLIVANGLFTNFWDGSNTTANGIVDGGTGTWNLSTPNWTNANGSFNQAYLPGLAIFAGTGGTVTVGEPVSANVIQFTTDGYQLTGGSAITLLSQDGAGGTTAGLIRVDAGVTATIGVPLDGTLGVEKADPGTLILTGVNTYTGGTTISAGTLQLGDGGATGSITGDVVNNGTLTFNQTSTFTFAGDISGTGALIQNGTGTVMLSGTNTYTGGTTINSGTLRIGGEPIFTSGSIVGDVLNNGALEFGRTNTYTFNGVISGTGTVAQVDGGTTILTATNSYSGGTTVAAGTLQVGDGPSSDATLGSGDIVDNATLIFNRSSLVYSGAITGTGQLQQVAAGTTLTFTGANTYSGGTTIDAGAAVQIGNGGLTGSIVGDVLNNGTLIFSRSNAYTFAGVISGTGNIQKLQGGTTTLTGANTYSGTTDIAAGTLQIGNGGTTGVLGTGTVSIASGAALTFNRSDSFGAPLAVPNTITGNGTINQIGAGGTALNGTVAADAVNVNAGALFINGTTTTPAVTVASGATLGGTGTVIGGTTTIGSGATLAPGPGGAGAGAGGTGTLTIGNLVLEAGSILAFDLGRANIIGGTSNDLLVVNGDITITNATLNVTDASAFATTPGIYRLVNYSGTITGTAADLILGTIPGYTPSQVTLQTNLPGRINLIVTLGDIVQFWDGPGTPDDGVISGGTAIWNNSAGNWTESTGTVNSSWVGDLGVFAGTPGTVTLGEDITFKSLQFSSSGYVVEGAGHRLVMAGLSGTTFSEIGVDSGMTATINAVIDGTTTLRKGDVGILILTQDNTYTGGTLITTGTLQLGNNGTTGMVINDIVDNALLVFNRSDDLIFPYVISGIGAVRKDAADTVTWTADNTYQGTTTITGGILQIGNGGTTGTLGSPGDVIIQAPGNLTFNRTAPMTVANHITGSGTVSQINTGVTKLTSNNDWAGVTTITAGSLQMGDGGTTGSIGTGDVTVAAGTSLISNRSNTLLLPNDISGAGSLFQVGSGTTIYTGTGTFTGGTTISAGTLQIGDGGTTGSIVGDVLDNGTLAFSRSNPYTFDGVVSGSGNVTQLGPSTVIFTATNTYAGTTDITGGTLQLGDGGTTGTLGAGTVTVAAPAQLVFDRGNAMTVGNLITGAGRVRQIGAGTTTLTAANTYSGGTNISNGELRLGDGGATGSIVTDVDVFAPGALAFNRNNAYLFSNVISGTGEVRQLGTGTTTLTATNTYSGVTTITAGTLELGSGGTAGSIGAGNVSVATGATLSFNRSDAVTFANTITGTGTIDQRGSGVTTLSGTDAASNTTVTAGTLLVTGALTSPVSVSASATLGGTGTITGDVVVNGTLAPGLSPGTLTITGSLTLASGSIMAWELGQPNIVGGSLNDLTVVNGNLTLAGATLNVADTGAFASTPGSYRLIDYTGTLTGDASNIALGMLAGVPPNTVVVQTGVVGQVNLIVSNGLATNFWDGPNFTDNGVVDGGSSTWNNVATQTNWTNANGTFNQSYIPGIAFFQGTAGTVNISEDVTANVVQFSTTGYLITPLSSGDLVMATLPGGGAPTITTDSGVTATIGATIAGTEGLTKNGGGTLILSGTNTLTGLITIDEGTLQLGNFTFAGALGDNDIVNNAALVLARTNVVNYAGVISGPGTLSKIGSSTTVFTGNSTYTGTTTLSAGILRLGNGGTTGAIGPGAIIDDAALEFNRSNTLTMVNDIGGTGTISQIGTGTTILTGTNTYSGATNVTAGTLQIGNGGTIGTLGSGDVANNGTLSFNRSDAITVANTITGVGTIVQAGSGSTTLSGTAAAGATTVSAGTLFVTGTLASPAAVDATLGGTGTIAGTVTVNSGGTLAPGVSGVGLLTMNALTLSGGSILDYQLGAPNVVGGALNDLVQVNGNLIVSGTTLNVADTGAFASTPGSYRLINYTGALTGSASDFTLGTLAGVPPNTVVVQTGVAGQVNLIVSNGLPTNFWDGSNLTDNGAVDGGTGTWNNATTQTNWTNANGTFNQSYIPGIAFFQGAAGTVTIGENVVANLVQFSTTGYEISAASTGTLTMATLPGGGAPTIRTDAGVSTIFGGVIAGSEGLTKDGTGTLILTGTNTLTGVVTIAAGTLQLGDGTFTGGLQDNDIVNNGALVVARSNAMTYAGSMSGSGTVTKQNAGTLFITGTNTYTGTTTISAGIFQIGDGGATGSIGPGDVINDATLRFDRANSLTFANTISGTGVVSQSGSGTTILTGTNSYSGATNITAGTLQIGDGGTTGTLGTGAVVNAATLAFNRSDAITVANTITGAGTISQIGSGTTTVSGTAAAGATNVSAGTLLVTGTLTSPVAVTATLGGTGTIAGTVTVNSGGTLAPGVGGAGTLTMDALVLNSGSILAFDLGAPDVIGGALNDLLQVNGNLTVSGTTLNVTDTGAFAGTPGSYRLINYTGSLTGSASDFGLGTLPGVPPNTVIVQTAVTGQVNLIVSNGLPVNFWDGPNFTGNGVVDGGTSTWNNSVTNWTNASGVINQSYIPGLAIFAGSAGTVTVGENVSANVMQFTTTGYRIEGGSTITMLEQAAGQPGLIRVDGGVTATIAATLAGTVGLEKGDAGTLILEGANTYTGGTTITAGVLQIGAGGTTGTLGAGAVVNNGELALNRADIATVANAISGSGTLHQIGTGITQLTGANTYGGVTTIDAGTLMIGNGGTTGTLGTGNVVTNSSLGFYRSNTLIVANAISGSGTIGQFGTGTTILTGSNTYAGTTLVSLGTLQVGDGGTTGTLGTGAVTNNAQLAFNRSNLLTVTNAISGSGNVDQIGGGTTVMTGASTYTGSTTVSNGTLTVLGSISSTSDVVVAPTATGAFRVEAGGSVTSGTGTIGRDAGAAGSAVVDGASNWTTTGGLRVGDAGTGTLTVQAGGTVQSAFGLVGFASGSQGTVNVTGSGSSWTTSGFLSLLAGTSTLTVDAGGLVHADSLTIAEAASATSDVVVTGAGSQIISDTTFEVGRSGVGTLLVSNGAVVTNAQGFIGRLAGGQGTAVVTGAGSLWDTTGSDLTIGNHGTGTLTIADGAVVNAPATYLGFFADGAGTLNIGAALADAAAAPGMLNTPTVAMGPGSATINFNHTGTNYTFAPAISGTGTVNVQAGTTVLTGSSSYTGAANVTGGTLLVNGTLGNTTTLVSGSGILGGTGTVVAATTIASGGTLSPGVSGAGLLTITGSLDLQSGSILAFDLGAPNVIGGALNDLVQVNGNLSVAGTTLNVADTGGFASTPGSYRLINYTGSLTGSASDFILGTLAGVPPNTVIVQTAVTGQVNLIVSNGLTANFWDGANFTGNNVVDGGTSTWNNALANWTDAGGAFNRAYVPGLAIFAGAAGTVTVAENVSVNVMQFTTTGYRVEGGSTITLLEQAAGQPGLVRADGGVTASIAATLAGTVGLEKADAGTLVLEGANSYSGGTTISGGVLQVGGGGTTGTLGTGAVVNDAALTFNRSDSLTVDNAISGTGALIQAGSGTTILTGVNSYSGSTTISAGTLQVGDGGILGSLGTGAVVDNGILAINKSIATTIAGAISGTGSLQQIGSGTTILTGANTYIGGTTITAGTLQLGDGGTTGSIVGDVTNNATLLFNRSDVVTFAGIVSGSGAVVQAGSGTTILTAANTYGGATTINAGTLQVGSGGTTGTLGTGAVANDATLSFNRSDAITVANTITGAGTIVQAGAGTTTLAGTAAAGATNVNAGTLLVTGTLTSPVAVAASSTLGGTGTIAGAVTVNSGATLAPGVGGAGTITMSALTLNNGSILAFDLGAPDVVGGPLNDLITVNGNLTLAGTTTLNVTDTGAFASTPGSYRLIDYSGTLTGDASNIALGSLPGVPPNSVVVQTAVTGHVNLIVSNGLPTNFWDGPNVTGNGIVDGGTGTWNNSTPNWTNVAGTINQSYLPGLAIFSGSAGTVTLGENVAANVIQFTTDGYLVTGAPALTMQAQSGIQPGLIRTDAGVTATIAAPIAGLVGIEKGDAGTLILAGANTYIGGTTVTAGILQVGSGGTSGQLGDGNVAVASGATLAFNRSDTAVVSQTISGAGVLTQIGSGTTALTAANTYTGGTTITAGTLQIGNGGTGGSIVGDVVDNGALRFNRSDAVVFTNIVSGTGELRQGGTGTVALTGANTYSGATVVESGTLDIGNGGATGVIGTGAVTVNSGATLAFDRGNAMTIANAISGAGTLAQIGSGVTTLSGTAAAGATTASAGTLLVTGTLTSPVTASGAAILGGTGTINGAVIVNAGATLSPGVSGVGTLTTGNLTLAAGSILAMELGEGGVIGGAFNDLITVNGNLTLAGTTLNITDTNTFASAIGVYRLINYSGTLTGTDADIILGATAGRDPGSIEIQTSVSGEVNLVTSVNGLSGSFWDGAGAPDDGIVSGGNGVWNSTNGLWTNAAGTLNRAWTDAVGVFSSAAGTVAIGDPSVDFQALLFTTDGYTIAGGGNQMNVLPLGSGTAGVIETRSGVTTTIDAVMTGASLNKDGAGTLIFSQDNTFSGLTINAGTVALGNGGTAGSVTGNIVNNGVLQINRSNTLTMANVVSGSGSLEQLGAGTTVLTGANTYAGRTTISSGILQVGDGGTTGTLGTGNTLNNAVLAFNRSDILTISSSIIGTGAVRQIGPGTTVFTGANLYTGTTTITQGTLQIGDGGTSGNLGLGAVINNGRLVFNRSDDLIVTNLIAGPGTIVQAGTGTTFLNGIVAAGAVDITAGTLSVNGTVTTPTLTVYDSGTLAGTGTVNGAVVVLNGGAISPGNSAGTLTLGSLFLNPGSILNYELSTPNVIGGGINDLIEITGDLTLDGLLNITDIGGFGTGIYRLMNYGGSLTDRQLEFGSVPDGFAYQISVSTVGQVNLIVLTPVAPSEQYWDGAGLVGNGRVDGGTGFWTMGRTNWTDVDGAVNQGWANRIGIFAGDSGTVTVVGSVGYTGLVFDTSGYTIVPGFNGQIWTLTDEGRMVINGTTTVISAPIVGDGGVTVEGTGTMFLVGDNSFTGRTTVGTGATVELGLDGNTGSVAGLITTNGTLGFNRGDIFTVANNISGVGGIRQDGSGTTVLTSLNSFSGGTTINNGVLQIAANENIGAPGGGITFNGGILRTTASFAAGRRVQLNGTGTIETLAGTTFSESGVFTGEGGLIKQGDGTLVLTGHNDYRGGTLVSAGLLQGTTNGLQGNIFDETAVEFDQAFDGRFAGTMYGTGTLRKIGTGSVLMTGDHGLSGLTTVAQGVLGLDGTLRGAVTVDRDGRFNGNGAIGGTLTVNGTVGVINSRDPETKEIVWGQLGVVGNIFLSPGAVYEVGIDPALKNSTLVTNGVAAINGAVVRVNPEEGIYPRVAMYPILGAAQGINGVATAISTRPTLEPYLTQTFNTLYLTLLDLERPLQPHSNTGSGWASGGALDVVKFTATGDLKRVTRMLQAMPDAPLAVALDQVAGEVYSTSMQMITVDSESLTELLRSEITSRISADSEDERLNRRTTGSMWGEDGRRGWVRLLGNSLSFDADGPTAGQGDRPGAHATIGDLQGLAGGIDFRSNGWLYGGGLGYSRGDIRLEVLDERAQADIFRAFGYGGYSGRQWAIDFGGGAAHMSRDVQRRFSFTALGPAGTPLFGTMTADASAHPSGMSYDGWVETRYNIAMKSWDLQPNAAVRMASYGVGQWTETGADPLSLSAPAQSFTSVQGDAGLRFSRAVGRFRPFFSAGYRHEFDSTAASLDVQIGPDVNGLFTVDGLTRAGDQWLGQAGLTYIRKRAGFSIYYDLHGLGSRGWQSLQFGVRF